MMFATVYGPRSCNFIFNCHFLLTLGHLIHHFSLFKVIPAEKARTKYVVVDVMHAAI